MEKLCDWFASEALPGRVTGVKTSTRLTGSPALLTGHEPEAMRRYRAMLTMMSDDATAAKLDALQNAAALELNPRHPIVRGIETARGSDDEATRRVAKLAAEQVFDNARRRRRVGRPRRWSRAYTISWRWRWRRSEKSDAIRDTRCARESERDGARRVRELSG